MEQVERIPSLVRTSLSSLESLSLALEEDSSLTSESATSRSYLSRLKLWSGCLGAHRVTGTRSLVYRLRDASSIRKTVLFLLENLERCIKEAKNIAQQNSAERDNGEDLEDSTDEELAEYFSTNDSDESPDNADLKRILSQIEEVLDCLMRLAITIRNPAPFDQFRSRTGVIWLPSQWDVEHVRHKFPNIHPILSDRLGKALTQRRQYLRYREEHHNRLQEGLDKGDEDDDGSKGKGTTIASYVPPEPRSDAPTVLEDTEDAYSDISTISYATTSADQGVPRIPPIPSEYETGPFLCPFCHMLISIDVEDEWKARLEWKKHVYRDLRPYVCLEVQCTMASQDFQKRKDWTRHMLQEHWRNWTCPFDCTLSFQTSNDARNHTLEKHKAHISTERVEILVSLSSNADLTCSEGKCPLCLDFDIKNGRMYESHVGKHLEQLTLFVLPQNGDDESKQDVDTQNYQDDNLGIDPEEEQSSDMGSENESEQGEEEVVLETAEGFRHEGSLTGNEYKPESEPEHLRPHGFAHHDAPASLPLLVEEDSYGNASKRAAASSRKCGVVSCDRKHVSTMIRNEKIYSSYCQDHTCHAIHDEIICINPRDPTNRYCSFHGKCIVRTCTAQASLSEKEPFPYICPTHRCVMKGCQFPRVEARFCERHAATDMTGLDRPPEMPHSVKHLREGEQKGNEVAPEVWPNETGAQKFAQETREIYRSASETLERFERASSVTENERDSIIEKRGDRVPGSSNDPILHEMPAGKTILLPQQHLLDRLAAEHTQHQSSSLSASRGSFSPPAPSHLRFDRSASPEDKDEVAAVRRGSGSPKGGHSFASGDNSRRHDKPEPLPPIIVEDSNDSVTMSMLSRKLEELKEKLERLPTYEELTRIASAHDATQHDVHQLPSEPDVVGNGQQ